MDVVPRMGDLRSGTRGHSRRTCSAECWIGARVGWVVVEEMCRRRVEARREGREGMWGAVYSAIG